METTASAAKRIQEAAARFVSTCKHVSDSDWGQRKSPDTWSIADIVEHVTIANGGLMRRLATVKEHALNDRRSDVIDEEIPYLFYRGDEPPNIATPTGRFRADRATMSEFISSAESIVEWAHSAPNDLRRFGVPHPVFGMFDGVQWLLFAAAHLERHRAQIFGELKRGASG